MSYTKYKTGFNGKEIEPVQIERETEHFVYIKPISFGVVHRERREAKSSEYATYHDSWQAAKDYLVRGARGKLEYAKKEVERAKSLLDLLEKLKEKP